MGHQTLKIGSSGDEVRLLQHLLHLVEDGKFGRLTDEAVKAFQKSVNLTADGVVGRLTWEALERVNEQEETTHENASTNAFMNGIKISGCKRVIKEIFVHCTASAYGVNLGVETIRREHIRQGWSDIGYHYVIMLDGRICEGRKLDLAGAHVSGHNSYSIGVCYVGGLDEYGRPCDTRTEAQKSSLKALLSLLHTVFPKAKIMGHRSIWGENTPFKWQKECPCFNAEQEYAGV